MVTIKDVAREAGVAISTVSNVFNNADIVSEDTKQKVLEAVEKLHYIPNMNAKLLKSNRKNTIGLFVTSLQGDFYKVLTQAIHLQCKLNDYLLNTFLFSAFCTGYIMRGVSFSMGKSLYEMAEHFR